jgi:hypothetical protein
MNYQYQIKNIILVLLYLGLNGSIDDQWIFFIFGLAFPFIDVFIFQDKYLSEFPWELYLVFAYGVAGFFIEIDHHFMIMLMGYAITRISIYFKIKDQYHV